MGVRVDGGIHRVVYRLRYGGLDRNVRHDGRPTTTNHDRGNCSPGNVSQVARVPMRRTRDAHAPFVVRTTRTHIRPYEGWWSLRSRIGLG